MCVKGKVCQKTKPGAEVLSLLQEKNFNGKHTNIICTRGSNPVAGLGGKANDGMISCDSQGATPLGFKNTQNITIEAGHSQLFKKQKLERLNWVVVVITNMTKTALQFICHVITWKIIQD